MQKLKMCIGCIFISLLIIKCSSSTEPIIKEQEPFITINIGDVRQYFDGKDLYIQLRVVDTTKRTDGKKVFAFEESFLLTDGIYKATNYYFIEDGFFKQTMLDTVKVPAINIENPFNEQRLAKLFPENGTCFLRNKGAADSIKIYFHIKLLDTLKTKYKTYNNIAKYEVISNSPNYRGASYYAAGYGHIGSTFIVGKDTANLFVTYLRVNEQEIGEYNNAFKKTVKKMYVKNRHLLRGIL